MGAYFAKEWGKRVLLIDLDFQGSLSSMAFPGKDWVPLPEQNSLATKLISGDIAPDLLASVARDVPLGAHAAAEGRLAVITAYYDLAQADNRILVEWLLQTRRRHARGWRQALAELMAGRLFRYSDARYTLAETLHAPPVRAAFDLVIIDCPPRLTTSEIQAFCAASHLLIPTILDRASGEAVTSLCGQVETLKTAGICPQLQYVGVVGTMVADRRIAQDGATHMIQDQLEALRIPTGLLPPGTFFRRSAHMVNNADQGIAYLAMPGQIAHQEIRDRVETLARYVAEQIGLPPPPSFQPASPPAPPRAPAARVAPPPAKAAPAAVAPPDNVAPLPSASNVKQLAPRREEAGPRREEAR
jgi:chromosome partitioning protein